LDYLKEVRSEEFSIGGGKIRAVNLIRVIGMQGWKKSSKKLERLSCQWQGSGKVKSALPLKFFSFGSNLQKQAAGGI